jgi:hypothetical protein
VRCLQRATATRKHLAASPARDLRRTLRRAAYRVVGLSQLAAKGWLGGNSNTPLLALTGFGRAPLEGRLMLISWQCGSFGCGIRNRHFDLGSPRIHLGESCGFSAQTDGFGREGAKKPTGLRVGRGLIVEPRSLHRASELRPREKVLWREGRFGGLSVWQAWNGCFGGRKALAARVHQVVSAAWQAGVRGSLFGGHDRRLPSGGSQSRR